MCLYVIMQSKGVNLNKLFSGNVRLIKYSASHTIATRFVILKSFPNFTMNKSYKIYFIYCFYPLFLTILAHVYIPALIHLPLRKFGRKQIKTSSNRHCVDTLRSYQRFLIRVDAGDLLG